jgi:N-carbamoylputrescine amidase
MKIAGIQISAGPDMDRNVERAVDMTEVAIEKGVKIVCYPELFLTHWFPRREDPSLVTLAGSVADQHLGQFQMLSKNKKVVIIVPFFEHAQVKYFNSAAVFDSGELLGIYRKIHIPDLSLYREQFYFSPGDKGFPVFESSQGRIGIQICWDNLFPEGSRILALKGAQFILAPTAASVSTHTLWERAICANAFANNIFIFRVNRVGKEDGISFYGRSFCVNPWGEMVSELAGSKDAIVIADIDLTESASAAETWGFLKKRRPGEYGDLVKEQ